jgi:SAM-dependent methyltransferase
MTTEIADDPLFRDPDFASFYDVENGDRLDDVRHDFAFCRALARDAASVLDLGCGTGELIASLAGGRRVVGADPAAAMLDVARERPDGDKVRWIEAGAQTLRVGETFDFVVLTGHAFQVFLTDDDVRAVLKTIATHLAPSGRFIFDTRSPDYRMWATWTPEKSLRTVTHPIHGTVKAWNDVAFDDTTAIATYQTFYEIPTLDRTLSASSQIRFIGKDRLATLIEESGLAVERWLGNWQGEAYQAGSREIIPIGHRP